MKKLSYKEVKYLSQSHIASHPRTKPKESAFSYYNHKPSLIRDLLLEQTLDTSHMYILLSKSVSVLNTSPSSLNWGILIICFYFNLLLKPKDISFIKGDTYTQTVGFVFRKESNSNSGSRGVCLHNI